MKFLKLLVAFSALVLLAGCAKKSEAPSENNTRIVWNYGNVYENGMLKSDNMDRLSFFDFDTFQSALLCSKPNCTHKNADDCSAFGMRNHPILYGDKLYFFHTDTEFDGEKQTDITTVWKADTDGTNRTKVCTIEELTLHEYTRMLMIDNMLYFSMSKMGYNEDLASSGNDECWLCSYDLSTNKFTRIEMLRGEWAGNTWIFGLYDGKVIFQFSYSDRKTVTIEDVEKYTTIVYKTYDIESGEIADLTLPAPLVVDGGYYIYEKNGGAAVLGEKGEELLLPDFPANGGSLTVADGMLFDFVEKKCADLTSGKMYSLNLSDVLNEFVAFTDGKYIILEQFDFDTQSREYYKVGKDELIGDAL